MNENIVELITFQHKNILEDLKKYEIYHCQFKSIYNKKTPKTYNLISKMLNKKLKFKTKIPIFCWYKVNRMNVSIKNKFIKNCNAKTGFDDNNVLIHLKVSEKLILHTNFHNFVDYRFLEEFPNNSIAPNINWDDFEKHIKEPTNDTIQTIISYIDKDWIINIYDIEIKENKEKIFDNTILLKNNSKELVV